MSKYILDTDKLAKGHYEEEKIKAYANDCFCGNELASVLYLWLFNNFSTNKDEVKYDKGRPMYRKLATTLTRLFEVQDD